MKHLRRFFLSALLLMTTVTTWAHIFMVDGINYEITSNIPPYEVRVTGPLYPEINPYVGDVIIPQNVIYEGITYAVTSIKNMAFYGCPDVTSIDIPNSVISIEDLAFFGCTGLTSITLGNSVTSIGVHAFWYCTNLISIDIPNSVTSIGQRAFDGCTGLISATIGNSLESIEEMTFYGCTGLTSVTIGNSVESIGGAAFYGCSNLISIHIPNSVTSIGSSAFYGCTGLTSVTIGNSVESIGASAFASCSSLTSIVIPNSVTSLEEYAFSDCTGLTAVTISNSVESIAQAVFLNCTGLTSISIPNSVTSIGIIAFADCTGLTAVSIGNSVESIGEFAFNNCTSLTSIDIPNSVTSIGDCAFEDCTSLISIDIPDSVTSMGEFAFADCTGLTAVSIGNSVESIGYSAFIRCISLISVTIGNSVTSIGNNAFYGCTSLTSIDIPDFVTSIGNYAFYGCTDMTFVRIGNSVTSIGDDAFIECIGLISVTIGEAIESIGDAAFAGCTGLESITMLAEEAPTLGVIVFNSVNTNIPVYVPCGSEDSYIGWGGFNNFIGMCPGAITAIANPQEGGYVTGGGEYDFGIECVLTAMPNEGYIFVNWTENGTMVSENSVYTFSVTGNRNFIANFFRVPTDSYVITATANPSEGGRIIFEAEEQTLLFEPFEEYTVGNKIAAGAIAVGHDWWTTWSNAPGSSEDGVVAEFDGTQCGHLTYGNDMVLLLGDEEYGNYDLEFDIFVPEGKNGYFNILHHFAGSNSTWAMQCYLHMTNDGQNSTQAPGHGTIHAGSNSTADIPCVYNAWMHFRLNVNTDTDDARYYYTAPGEDEILICEWQWSLDSFGENVVGRTLSAMDFFCENTSSEFYLDNFRFNKVNGESAPALSITPTSIQRTLGEDDITSVPVTINNYGNSIGEWSGWIDFGQGGAGSQTADLYYHNGDVSNALGIGSSDAYTREIAICLPGFAYTGASMGMKITSTQYYISDGYQSSNYNYIFRIYGQGRNNQPGELLAEKTIYSTATGTWITATFDNPVYMTGQTIWATVQLEQAAGEYPLSMDSGEYGEEQDGNWLSTNGNNFTHCYSNGAFGGAWLITVNCQGELIPATWAFIDKIEGAIMGGQSETITLSLNSIGLNSGTSYNANLIINTNDEYLSHVEIPVTLNVNYTKAANEARPSEPLLTVFDNISNRGGSVRVSGTYTVGAICIITAIANPGYTFINWTKNGEVISTASTYSFTVTEDAAFVANFTENQGTITQNSTFSQGYNWWATYIEQDGIDGLGMLQDDLGSNGVTIRSQASGYNDYYAGYGWFGSLSGINNESSYRVITSAPCSVTLTGNAAVPSQHPITLSHGWTWIGYVPSTAMDVNVAIAGLTPTSGDKLKSQQGYSDYYEGYGWFGSLNTIVPGMGLMYYSTNSSPITFTYPDSNRGGEVRANLTPENNHWVPNVYAYPDNMTVMAVVELDDKELISDKYELAAFTANGECRGSVKLTYAEPLHRHVAFLTISGNDAAELSFRLYDTETGMEYFDAEEGIGFVANAIIGDASDLYVVHFRGTTGMDELAGKVRLYPNPVNGGEQFSINITDAMKSVVRVEIVNALGVVVETVQASSVQTLTAPNAAGVYTVRITVEGKETAIRKLVVK